MFTPAPSSRACRLLYKASCKTVGAQALVKMSQDSWAITLIVLTILMVATVAAAAITLIIHVLETLSVGMPLVLVPVAMTTAAIAGVMAIRSICRRLARGAALRAALERARLLLVQSMHHVAARGDGGVLVGRIDLHDAGISRASFSRAAAFDAATAALLSALAFLAERIIAFTARFSSSLRVSATA